MAEYYIHSKCCMGTWNLYYKDGTYDLRCSQCGLSVGSGVKVIGPAIGEGECECCKGEGKCGKTMH